MEIKRTFKSGNSLVVSLGRESKHWLKLEQGDQVMLQLIPGGKVMLTKVTKSLQQIVEKGGVENGES